MIIGRENYPQNASPQLFSAKLRRSVEGFQAIDSETARNFGTYNLNGYYYGRSNCFRSADAYNGSFVKTLITTSNKHSGLPGIDRKLACIIIMDGRGEKSDYAKLI